MSFIKFEVYCRQGETVVSVSKSKCRFFKQFLVFQDILSFIHSSFKTFESRNLSRRGNSSVPSAERIWNALELLSLLMLNIGQEGIETVFLSSVASPTGW